MNSDEIILYKINDSAEQKKIMNMAIDYAILSIPFTFDRLGNRNLTKNILNIAKGKFAESYFYSYCDSQDLNYECGPVTTPFYQADKKDFVLNDFEWDIKNNFLVHDEHTLNANEYLDQLALIPNRGAWDQWSKRNSKNLQDTKGTGYVFTYMKKGTPNDKNEFLKINMNLAQKNLMLDLYEKYEGKNQHQKPYGDDEFWEKFYSVGPEYNYELTEFPTLVICGIALENDFQKFRQIKPSSIYSKYLRTIIENMGTEIGNLNSFQEYNRKS